MKKRLLTILPWLLLVAATLWLAVEFYSTIGIFVRHGWNALTFPYALDYGEGPVLDQAVHLAKFQSIYTTTAFTTTPPFAVANYPPVYHLVQAPFIWIFGPAMWYGRAISLLSVVLAALFVGLIVQALTHDGLAGAIGGLVLLSMPHIMGWSGFVRVDGLALALSLAGLYTTVRWPEGRRSLIVSAILLTLAAYTKQSYALAAPLAAFTWLLSQRKLKRALFLAGLVAGLGGSIFLIFNLATRGSFFFNIITANANKFYWETVRNNYRDLSQRLLLMVLGCVVFVALGLWKKIRPATWWLVVPYLLGAIVEFITIGKVGSSINYVYELAAAFGLVAGALVAWPGKQCRWASALIIALLATQVNSMYAWSKDIYNWVAYKFEHQAEVAEMARIVQEARGPVLADEYMALVPLAGQTLYVQPFEYKQVVEAGIWDDAVLVKAIRNKTFDVILIYDPKGWSSFEERWTPALQAAIREYYRPNMVLAETILYRP